jgi:hypothetical protein
MYFEFESLKRIIPSIEKYILLFSKLLMIKNLYYCVKKNTFFSAIEKCSVELYKINDSKLNLFV